MTLVLSSKKILFFKKVRDYRPCVPQAAALECKHHRWKKPFWPEITSTLCGRCVSQARAHQKTGATCRNRCQIATVCHYRCQTKNVRNRMSAYMPERMSEEHQKEHQNTCQKEYQNEYHNTCQKEYQNTCQKECQVECQNRCQIWAILHLIR